MPNSQKTIITTAIEELLFYYITEQIPFTLTVDNYNNWDKPLPARLELPQFTLNIENTDLEESYVHSNGDIVITAGIDDFIYQKVFTAVDIAAIGTIEDGPVIRKPYKEYPQKDASKPSIATDGVMHSLECFVKNNPDWGINVKELA